MRLRHMADDLCPYPMKKYERPTPLSINGERGADLPLLKEETLVFVWAVDYNNSWSIT